MTTSTVTPGTATESKWSSRVQSVDLLRGAVMVLMAIDHVRVYSGMPAGGPSPGIFFTRWVTHFCAPAFVFFAGTSAFLYGMRINNKKTLTRYLFTRGLLLIILELTLIRFCWTFNLNFSDFILFGVIWMLGWCMIALAALVYLSPLWIGMIGLAIIFFQNVFQYVPAALPASARESFGRLWEFIYTSGFESWKGITILYVLIPWIGVIAAGYSFGAILMQDAARRKRICLWIGLSAIAAFLAAGIYTVLSQPATPDAPPFLLRLLNQRKYPASQLYLLMTLGPVIALVPWAEQVRGWFANALRTLGRVPMFYYLLHIPLIHITALVVNLIRTGSAGQSAYQSAPYVYMPEQSWGLPLLYVVFIIDVIVLYFICRWYARYKMQHPEQKWLKYL